MAKITITAEERNEIWELAEFALGGAAEGLYKESGVPDHQVAELRLWFDALDALGYEREAKEGCSVPASPTILCVLQAAENQALDVLRDASKTLAQTLAASTAAEVADRFLPPADGDTEGQYLTAVHHIKAVRERVEAAEPGLRKETAGAIQSV